MRIISYILLILLISGIPASSILLGQEVDLNKKIKSLEEQLDALKSEVNAAEKRRLEDMFKSVDIHGFVSQGYVKSQKNNIFIGSKDGSFQYNEIGIYFYTELSDKLHVGIQLLSRDYGDTDNNKINIDWAYADYRWQDWMGFRAGKMKIPMGLYSETRDIDSLRTCIFLPINNFYNEDWREVFNYIQGISVYGDIFMESAGTLSYNIQWGYTHFDDDSGTSKLAKSIPIGELQSIESDYTFTAHLDWETPIDGLKLAGTMAQMKYDHTYILNDFGAIFMGGVSGAEHVWGFDPLHVYTASAEYMIGDLILFSEFMHVKIINKNVVALPKTWRNYNWHAGGSYQVNDWFSIGSYYSESFDADDRHGRHSDPTYSAWTRDFTLSTRFNITENWTFKLEGHYIDGTKEITARMNPDGRVKNFYMFAAKTTVSF